MSQQLQNLIDKIKKEGVDQASELSRSIEAQARQKAEEIIQQAKQEAQEIIANAQAEQQKLSQVTHIALKQAARDAILNLRKAIDETLQKIILRNVQASLPAQSLGEIIRAAISNYLQNVSSSDGAIISVSDKDFAKLQDGFIAELKSELKKSLVLKSNADIGAGFTISFDSGKSFFDFTDVSLADYLASSVNAQLAALLKESVKS